MPISNRQGVLHLASEFSEDTLAVSDRVGSSARPQRLRRALGAGQIVDDRGGVLRRYRSLVDVDHLIHDLLPNLPRLRGLIQRVIGRQKDLYIAQIQGASGKLLLLSVDKVAASGAPVCPGPDTFSKFILRRFSGRGTSC